MIHLILIDVDGTLVGVNGIHATTAPALEEARARGVHLGLCTGRIGQGAALDYARLIAPEGLHVFQSGAIVSPPGGPAVYASRLERETFVELVRISRREGVPLEAYGERSFYLDRETDLTRAHAHHLGFEPELCDLLAIAEPIVRAQWVVTEAEWPRFRAIAAALPGIEAHPATGPWSPGTIFSNLTRAGTSKAAALRFLAGHLGFGAENVAMVGDAENDLDAIGAAGLGIAMGNAPATVKAQAGAIVADADSGGLAEAIRLALAT